MSDVLQNSDAIRFAGCRLHSQIRDTMRTVTHLAAQVHRGNTDLAGDLCSALQRLAAEVRKHEVEEREALDPFLAAVDAWGAERVRRIEGEHRAEDQIVSGNIAGLDATALVRAARSIVYRLVRLLREEERESFSRDVLRGDFIAIDQEDG